MTSRALAVEQPERREGPLTRRTWLLLAFSAALAVLEAALLQAVGFTSAIPLAPQVSASAPLAVFHDLRWVWTFARSPWSTVWMLAALIAFRTVVNATMTWLAWPVTAARPAYPTLLRRSLSFTGLAVVVMSPWVTVDFVGGATGLSSLVLGAIIGSGLTALVLPPGIITGEWWRKILPLRSMGWILLNWLSVTLAALAITYSPDWVTVLAALGGGLLNGLIWQRIVHTVVHAGRPRWTIPAMPLVAVLVSGALLVLGGFVFSGVIGESDSAAPAHGRAAPSGSVGTGNGPPVIYVGGFDSRYSGGPVHLLPRGFDTVAFSYKGLGKQGQPLPYGPLDTHQSLATSARLLAQQVQMLHRRTGRPVSLVAESEGTMVAVTYVDTLPHPALQAMVELSTLVRPGRVYYPLAGDDGYGYVAGWEARAIMSLFRAESPKVDLTADMPFLRSMVDHAPLYRDHTLCPPPGVRAYVLEPLEGALEAYRGPLIRIPWTTFPGYHASLLSGPHTQQIVAEVLHGKPHRRRGWETAFHLIQGAAGAWQVPALPLHARAAWHAAPDSDPAFGNWACPQPR